MHQQMFIQIMGLQNVSFEPLESGIAAVIAKCSQEKTMQGGSNS
jgi:hypothetical protein